MSQFDLIEYEPPEQRSKTVNGARGHDAGPRGGAQRQRAQRRAAAGAAAGAGQRHQGEEHLRQGQRRDSAAGSAEAAAR